MSARLDRAPCETEKFIQSISQAMKRPTISALVGPSKLAR
jgi:hypothetical protein